MYRQDCDGDGRVTCKDFGWTHLLGETRCRDPARRRDAEGTVFVGRFARCLLQTLRLLQAGDDVRPDCVRQELTAAALAHSQLL